MKTEADVRAGFNKIAEKASETMQAVAAFAADNTSPMMQVFHYEFNRRFEEAMHRVQDMAALQAQLSDENMKQVVKDALDKAAATGQPVVTVEGK